MKKIISLSLAMLMILSSLLAVVSCSEQQNGEVVKVVEIPLTAEEYAFAVEKGNTELLNSLNEFMKTIKDNGQFDEIMNKYFGDGTPTAVKSATEMKTDGSQLIVATNAAFEPFEYKIGENYYGVDMEIMALFAQHLGKELYINNMPFDAVCLSVSALGGSYEDENGTTQTVQGGVCDVAAAGLTVKPDRAEILDFTTTYYNASQLLIVAADDTTFDACKTKEDVEKILNGFDSSVKVGVQNGTTGKFYCEGDESFDFAGYKFTTVGYDNGALAVQNIINGNVKYVVIDEGPAKAIVKNINEVN